ncbi:MAG TPA: hypothetical protein VLZ28_00940, partial [Daejeonella sp.]|nr:hypothetical protein [Daejeonella sp.]
MKNLNLLFLIAVVLCSCSAKKQADLLVYNANVYTVDDQFSTTEAFAVKDGKILETGLTKD